MPLHQFSYAEYPLAGLKKLEIGKALSQAIKKAKIRHLEPSVGAVKTSTTHAFLLFNLSCNSEDIYCLTSLSPPPRPSHHPTFSYFTAFPCAINVATIDAW